MQVILFTDVADTPGYGKYAGTYKIATEIRNAGYSCQVIDLFSYYSYNQLEKILDKFITKETILIGFSCTLMEKRIGAYGNPSSKVYNFGRSDEEIASLLQYAKRKNTKIKAVVGGARMNLNAYWPDIEYVIVNKGDVAIIKLIEHLLYGNNLPAVKTSPCIVIDGSSDDYFYTQDQFAKSSIIYQPEDIVMQGECIPIEIARGCVFKCAYCHFDLIGKKIGDWQKDAEVLRNEMMRNYELYGTTHYMFSDELVNESMPKMQMVYDVIMSLPFKITYTSYARLDLIWRYPKMRDMLLESGAVSIAFGIETMNESTGKKIGKGLGEGRIKETLAYCAETWAGKVVTSSQFIIGLPGEDKDSIYRTLDYLVSDECNLDIFGFLPLFIRPAEDGRSNSLIDKDPKKYGYTLMKNEPWQGSTMNFKEAVKLVNELYTDPRMQRRVKFGAATWMGRILNIGYSIDDVFRSIKDDNLSRKKLTEDIESKSIFRKDLYIDNLMKI